MFKKMKVGDVVTIRSAEEAELLKQIEGKFVYSDWKNRKCQIERIDDPIVKYRFRWYDHGAKQELRDNFFLPNVPPIPDGYEPAYEGEVVEDGWKFYSAFEDIKSWHDCKSTIGRTVQYGFALMIKPKAKSATNPSLPEPMKDNEYAHFETREEWERFKEINDLSKMQLQSTCLENIDKHYAPKHEFHPFYLASARGHIAGYALSSTIENLKFILQFSTETKEYTGHKKHVPKQEPQIIRNESGTAVGVAESYIKPGEAVCQYAGKVFPFKSLSFTEQPANQDVCAAVIEISKMISSRPSTWIDEQLGSTPDERAAAMKKFSDSVRRQEIVEVVKLALENM